MKLSKQTYGAFAAFATVLSLGLIVPVSSADAAEPEGRAVGTSYYVDCSAGTNGTGTEASPFNTLEAANGVTLQANDKLLFKRGTTCVSSSQNIGGQTLRVGLRLVNVKGTSQAPVVIDAYGNGSAPKIDGEGVSETVLLRNSKYVTISNLDISNTDAEANRYQYMRRGIVAENDNAGELDGITIQNNNVHDIYGEKQKDLGGSAAIQFETYGRSIPVEGPSEHKSDIHSNVAREGIQRSWFDDVQILNNTITNVNRSGINMSTDFRCREDVAWECGVSGATRDKFPWTPNKNMYIAENTLKDIGGDGIVVQMSDGAVVEKNYLEDAASVSGQGSNAGIWNWNSDNTLFQYNEVTNTQKTSDNNDGTAWDFDYGTRNTVFQYNYSHGNAGGSALVCACTDWYGNPRRIGTSVGGTFRYNVSIDDGVASHSSSCSSDTHRTVTLDGITDMNFYNNTIVLPEGSDVTFSNNAQNAGVSYINNVLIARSGTLLSDQNDRIHDDGFQINYGNNLYVGSSETRWAQAGDNGNSHVALSDFLTGTGIDLRALGTGDLRSLYSATATSYMAGKGRAMASDDFPFALNNTHLSSENLKTRDFPHGFDHVTQTYGAQHKVSGWSAPAVGAFQGADSVEQGIVGTLAAGQSKTVDAPGNSTLEVRGTGLGNAQLGVSVDNGRGYVQKTTNETGAKVLHVRTSSDSSKIVLTNFGTSGSIADVSVKTVHDQLWDGSFESVNQGGASQPKNGISPWAPANRDHSKNRDNYNDSMVKRYRSERNQSDSVVSGERAAKLGMADGVSFDQIDQRNIPAQPGKTYELGFWVTTGASNGASPSQVSATVKSRAEGSGAGGSFDQYQDVLLDKSVEAQTRNGGEKIHVTGTFLVPWDVPADSALWVNIAQSNLDDSSAAYVDDVTLVQIPNVPTDVKSMTVSKQPSKTVYQQGENFDVSGLEVTGTLADGTKRVLAPSEYSLVGFTSAKPGIVPIIVKLNADGSVMTKFRVGIQKVTNLAQKFCSSAQASDVQDLWGGSSAGNACDGDLGTNWSNWKSSSESAPANPSWLSWKFDGKHKLDKLELYLEQSRGEAAPERFTVQYLAENDSDWETSSVVGTPDASNPAKPTTADLSSLPKTKGIKLLITPGHYGTDYPYSKVSEVNIFEQPDSVPVLQRIEVATPPSKVTYTVGDVFNPSGLQVEGTWTNQFKDQLLPEEYTLGAVNSDGKAVDYTKPFASPGEVTVKIRVNGNASISTTFVISVKDKTPAAPVPSQSVVTGIKVASKPAKTEYKIGDVFSSQGLQVKAEMADGTQRSLSAEEYTFSAFDTKNEAVDLAKPFSKAGTVIVTISLLSRMPYTTTFAITVRGETLGSNAAPVGTPQQSLRNKELAQSGSSVVWVIAFLMIACLLAAVCVGYRSDKRGD